MFCEHASQGASRGVATSIPQFVQQTDTLASETPMSETTDAIIKTSHTVDVMTQGRHNDPESNPDDGKPTYGFEIS
jgi:hypothetical protein